MRAPGAGALSHVQRHRGGSEALPHVEHVFFFVFRLACSFTVNITLLYSIVTLHVLRYADAPNVAVAEHGEDSTRHHGGLENDHRARN